MSRAAAGGVELYYARILIVHFALALVALAGCGFLAGSSPIDAGALCPRAAELGPTYKLTDETVDGDQGRGTAGVVRDFAGYGAEGKRESRVLCVVTVFASSAEAERERADTERLLRTSRLGFRYEEVRLGDVPAALYVAREPREALGIDVVHVVFATGRAAHVLSVEAFPDVDARSLALRFAHAQAERVARLVPR